MKILLVEDSETVSERLNELLSEVPSVQLIGAASDVETAVRRFQRAKPDAIILDLKLQAGSGFDVLRHVKATKEAPLVIILTNYAFDHYRAKGEELGADYFFDKSTEFEKVVAVVRGATDV